MGYALSNSNLSKSFKHNGAVIGIGKYCHGIYSACIHLFLSATFPRLCISDHKEIVRNIYYPKHREMAERIHNYTLFAITLLATSLEIQGK